jgi:hypothetical protein
MATYLSQIYTSQFLLDSNGDPIQTGSLRQESDSDYYLYTSEIETLEIVDRDLQVYARPDVPLEVKATWLYDDQPDQTFVDVGVNFAGETNVFTRIENGQFIVGVPQVTQEGYFDLKIRFFYKGIGTKQVPSLGDVTFEINTFGFIPTEDYATGFFQHEGVVGDEQPNDYLEYRNPLRQITTEFSLSFHIKPSSKTDYEWPFNPIRNHFVLSSSDDKSSATVEGFNVYYDWQTQQLTAQIINTDASEFTAGISQSFINFSSFNYVAINYRYVYDVDQVTILNKELEIMINNDQANRVITTIPADREFDFSNIKYFYVGADEDRQNCLNGYIIDFLILDRVLTDTEIQNHYIINQPWYDSTVLENEDGTSFTNKTGKVDYGSGAVIRNVASDQYTEITPERVLLKNPQVLVEGLRNSFSFELSPGQEEEKDISDRNFIGYFYLGDFDRSTGTNRSFLEWIPEITQTPQGAISQEGVLNYQGLIQLKLTEASSILQEESPAETGFYHGYNYTGFWDSEYDFGAGTWRWKLRNEGSPSFILDLIVGSLQVGAVISQGIDNTGYHIDTDSLTATTNITTPGLDIQSSRKLKHKIKPYKQSALEIIKGIDIVEFEYKSIPNAKKVGFIAEDTDPTLSTENQDKMDTGSTIGVLLKAVQELTEQVEFLKEKVRILESNRK